LPFGRWLRPLSLSAAGVAQAQDTEQLLPASAKDGKNDCKAGAHELQGQSKVDSDPQSSCSSRRHLR